MARYPSLLGLQVEVTYRAGDILLPASGTFVGDTGRSIFLEQSFEQHGQRRNFRWEIPYQYIVKLAEKTDPVAPAADKVNVSVATHIQEAVPADGPAPAHSESAASAAAAFGSQVAAIFPRPRGSES
jgi:hypothetical protein